MSEWYERELKNKNYLSPIGFRLIIQKSPKVSFLCQEVQIPSVDLGQVNINYRGFVPLPVEGNVKYGDFTVEFLVDEDLENYLEIHDWIRGLGVPSSFADRPDYLKGRRKVNVEGFPSLDSVEQTSDATLIVQNNNLNQNFEIVFKDMFPVNLAALPFSVLGSDNDYLTARVTFAYTYFDIVKSYDGQGIPQRAG